MEVIDIFKELPNDIQEYIIDIKHREYQEQAKEVLSIFEEAVEKNWYKYCNCLTCKARRARWHHFVEAYLETF